MNSTFQIQEIIDDAKSLVSPPKVYLKLMALIEDPSTDFDDLAQLISTDVSIAARLLKVANSAMFNFPGKIDTIDRALSLIGTKQAAELILATEMLKSFNKVTSTALSIDEFTRHSLGCAISARVLAQYKREHDVEVHFVNGLLHDIGRLLLYLKFPDIQTTLSDANKQEAISFRELEIQQYGWSHDDIGAEIFKAWNLPEAIIAATAYHHNPLAYKAHSLAATLVHVADWITHCAQLGSNGEHFIPPLEEEAWIMLGIEDSALETILAEILKQYHSAAQLLL